MSAVLPFNDQAWCEIDLSAICENYRALQDYIWSQQENKEGSEKPRTLMPVIKSDAYGHGAVQVARALLNDAAITIERFIVYSIDEGIDLRKAGISTPIFVLSPLLDDAIPLVLEYDLEVTCCDAETLVLLDSAAQERTTCLLSVHVKFDTGMGRSGLLAQDDKTFFQQLRVCKNISLISAYTHFASAYEEDLQEVQAQADQFQQRIESLRSLGFEIPNLHLCNSAALLRMPLQHAHKQRSGIALFGYPPLAEVSQNSKEHFTECLAKIKPAMSVYARVLRCEQLTAGSQIGYGSSSKLEYDQKVALLSIGYGDGIPFQLSHNRNGFSVGTKGQPLPLIGRVSMNCICVNADDWPDLKKGDVVPIMGPGAWADADGYARSAQSNAYQILCAFGQVLPRRYS